MPLLRHRCASVRAALQLGRICPGKRRLAYDGLLHIELVREVPEAMKPRRIAITSGSPLLTVTLRNLSSSPRPPAANVSMYSREHVAMTELGRKDTFEVEKLLHPARSYTHPSKLRE